MLRKKKSKDEITIKINMHTPAPLENEEITNKFVTDTARCFASCYSYAFLFALVIRFFTLRRLEETKYLYNKATDNKKGYSNKHNKPLCQSVLSSVTVL